MMMIGMGLGLGIASADVLGGSIWMAGLWPGLAQLTRVHVGWEMPDAHVEWI